MSANAADTSNARSRWWAVTVLLLVGGSAARLTFLEADPFFTGWLGYVVDEGRWVETARNIALFRDVELYELSKVHLALSPGFQLATLGVFEAFGVHLWSARLLPALAGTTMLVLFALTLRRWIHPAALAFGIAMLAFEGQFLFLGRIALPEMPSLLLTAGAFALAVAPGCRPLRALLAGATAAAAVAMKGTSIFVMPVFGLLMLIDPGVARTMRVRNLLAYAAGLGGPMLAGYVAAATFGLLRGDVVQVLAGFLRPVDPWFFAWRLRNLDFFLASHLLLLFAWLGSLSAFSRASIASSIEHRVLVSSAMWCAGWAAVWLWLEYLPERYVVHLQFPALLCGTAGLSIALRNGLPGFEGLADHTLRRLALGTWLALPSAVLSAPVAVAMSGADVTGIRVAFTATLAIASVLGLVAAVNLERPGVVAAAVTFPLATIATWLATGAPLSGYPVFWPTETLAPEPALVFALAIGACASLAVAAAGARRRLFGPWTMRIPAALAATAVVTAMGSMSLTHLLEPRFTVRSESERLGTEIAGTGAVYARESSTLLLPTRLRHREQWPMGKRMDAVVLTLRPRPGRCVSLPRPLDGLIVVRSTQLDLEWSRARPGVGPYHLVVLRSPGEQPAGRQPGRRRWCSSDDPSRPR